MKRKLAIIGGKTLNDSDVLFTADCIGRIVLAHAS